MPVAIYSTRRRPDGKWTIRGAIGDAGELVEVTVTADLGDEPTIEDAAAALAASVFVAPATGEQAGTPQAERAADNAAPGNASGAATDEASPDAGSTPAPGASTPDPEATAAAETFVELDGTVVAVLAWLAEITDAEQLTRIGAAERAGKSRKSVLAAIEGRLQAVSEA